MNRVAERSERRARGSKGQSLWRGTLPYPRTPSRAYP